MAEPKTADNWIIGLTVAKLLSLLVAVIMATTYVNYELIKGADRDNKIENNFVLMLEGDVVNYERTTKISKRDREFTQERFNISKNAINKVEEEQKMLRNQLIEALISINKNKENNGMQ